MAALTPSLKMREEKTRMVTWSLLLPGAGHLILGRRWEALGWFALCQFLLFGGFVLAGATQLDYGRWIGFGSMKLLCLMAPECGNFLASQLAAVLFQSAENGGHSPELIPWRHLGHCMSGAAGVLAFFSAAHASGLVLVQQEPLPPRHVTPGKAAVATLLLPGLGHFLLGRKFKAVLFGGVVMSFFVLGLALGEFADFNRQRHPYYWIGQMFVGVPGWLGNLVASARSFAQVLPYQDAGLMLTTVAGLFNIVVGLDAYARSEQDWLEAKELKEQSAA
ncbi:MAG TPA: hypothetical protein DDW23_08280 [Planctomycetes bacterium]|nr:hypothetical protein [Planctomycetota bacterium]